MSRGLCRLILALSIPAVLAGCGGGGSAEPGTITGSLAYAGTATAPAAAAIALAPPAGSAAYGTGAYTVTDVPPGDYVMTVTAAGYTAVSVAVTVTAGGTVTRHIELASDTGLLAYYPFSGDANDASGLNKHGTVTGAVAAADRFGRANNAYIFDGDGDYITVPSLWEAPAELTVAAWVKAAGIPEHSILYPGPSGRRLVDNGYGPVLLRRFHHRAV